MAFTAPMCNCHRFVERCILLGCAEISDSDRDTIVHRSGISIPIMNHHQGKLRFFKFGTKLKAQFTSATNPIVEQPMPRPFFSGFGEAIANSPSSCVIYHLMHRTVEGISDCFTNGRGERPRHWRVAWRYRKDRTWSQKYSSPEPAGFLAAATALILAFNCPAPA